MLYVYLFCLANVALFYLDTVFAYQWRQIECIRKPIFTNITDCHAAIAIIPTGKLAFDPQPHTLGNPDRFNLNLPASARSRRFKLPAAFRSGNCAIYVFYEPHAHRLGRTEPIMFKFQGASAMYITVWPDVRRVASRIVDGCHEGEILYGGFVHTGIRTRAGNLPYVVRVTTVPTTMEGDGSMFRYASRSRIVEMTVYEAGGTAGTKSFQPIYGPWRSNPHDRNDLIQGYWLSVFGATGALLGKRKRNSRLQCNMLALLQRKLGKIPWTKHRDFEFHDVSSPPSSHSPNPPSHRIHLRRRMRLLQLEHPPNLHLQLNHPSSAVKVLLQT